MKAIGFIKHLPIDDPASLIDFEAPTPSAGPRDLVVNVRAVSVNPVDAKIRGGRHQGSAPAAPSATPRVIGWDAAGVVASAGPQARGFAIGDEVMYAGALERPGANAEFHAVDFALVGKKPKSLSFSQAAALPLTAITAWELLFDRLGATEGGNEGEAILITGGAGGVGSILIQLARRLTRMQVIATASRAETARWCTERGAHFVIDHTRPMGEQIRALDGAGPVRRIASLTGTTKNYPQLVEILEPQGRIGVIDDPPNLDVVPLKRKAASLHWEFMFARSMWRTPDMAEQGKLLSRVASLVDEGVLHTTQSRSLSPINAANLREAHRAVERGDTIGKFTLDGF